MNLKDLKQKSPTELLTQAEELGIEDASSMRKQDLMFGILKKIVGEDEAITGEGTIEVMQDGFGFLRSSESNYLAGPDDIYVSPKFIYDNVADMEAFTLGAYTWNGYTCTSLGYPYTMLEATHNGCVFQVMILMKNGEHEVSLNDADVRSIIESISICE